MLLSLPQENDSPALTRSRNLCFLGDMRTSIHPGVWDIKAINENGGKTHTDCRNDGGGTAVRAGQPDTWAAASLTGHRVLSHSQALFLGG